MVWFWIVLGVVVVIGGVLALLSLGFRNRRVAHNRTPAVYGIRFQEVRFRTRNEKWLYGWWIPAGSDGRPAPAIVLVHGWGRNVERMLPYIEKLHPEGYHLLAFDSRHHGSSDPDGFSSMLKFAEDIMAALDYLATRPEIVQDRIGVLGLSIGGAATIYAAAHDPRIRAAVTIGAFAHPAKIMELELRKAHVPAFLFRWLLLRYVELRIGARLDTIAPVRNIARVRAPLLLVHGDQDRVVPLAEGRRLADASNPETTQFWIVPGKGHSDPHTHPDFWPRVKAFFEAHLRQEPARPAAIS